MKSNAIGYLKDVGFKRINERFDMFGAFGPTLMLDRLLRRKEKISIKTKRGFAIQMVDRRAQYERRKHKAEKAGLGF